MNDTVPSWVTPAATATNAVQVDLVTPLPRATAQRIDTLLRWVTELVGVDFPAPDGRSTVTDAELLAAAPALADEVRLSLGASMTGRDVDTALRTLLGLIGDDPEAYRDDVARDDIPDGT